MAASYEFQERLLLSSGFVVSRDMVAIMKGLIPGALNVHQAHAENDRNGVDWWVEMPGGRFLAVDAKVRERDWCATHPDEDDLALESWSVVEKNKPGWTRDPTKRCDYVLWLWVDTGRYCLVPFHMLCRVFTDNWQQWRTLYKTSQQHTPGASGGWHSECIFVPRREVWSAIYRQYGGRLAA